MILRTYKPTAPLNKYVELLAYYKGYNPEYPAERLLPEGNVEILIALDDIQRCFYDGVHLQSKVTCRRAWISGMHQGYFHANADKDSSLFAIKFKAGGSYPFLHLPLLELNNLFVEADLILGNHVISLREQLLHTENPDDMFLFVENFLMERFSPTSPQQAIANFAATKMTSPLGSTTLKSIATEVGYSQKQLIQLFKKYVGLSPKQYQRLQRFNTTLQQIHQQTYPTSQMNFDFGYYDQAHFINEFKHFSGYSPKAYLAHRGEFHNFIPIHQKG